ncbi:hypothetical protein P692DRAFT_20734239, partial [Suillus brevipes Sb2]
MTHEDLLDHLSSTTLPVGCPRNRASVLSAAFQNLYGEQVAIALRGPPDLGNELHLRAALSEASVDLTLPWLSVSIDDLTRRLEKLSRAEINLCLRRLPSTVTFRKPHDLRSHRKTCNALVHHIRKRAFMLFQATSTSLADLFQAHFPFIHLSDQSDTAIVAQILNHEFGHGVMTRLSQELLSASAMLKLNRDLHRHSAIREAETIRAIQQAEWPARVSQHVVLSCVRDYMTGSAWSEPCVCAVCSCY